jgi:hypothetical protein
MVRYGIPTAGIPGFWTISVNLGTITSYSISMVENKNGEKFVPNFVDDSWYGRETSKYR